ncbi:MAG: type II toxin-antitoxin system VapC family toxin [Ideonella sp. WA131b]|nr:type II toxin-antitoxin system VapC family toxin [Ideonella sp. WA131b]
MGARGPALIVLDSSYAMALVMPDEVQPPSMATVLADELTAPFIWPLEIASAMRMNLRRGRLTPDDSEALFKRIASLRVEVMGPPHALPQRHVDAAQEHELTPYDTTYITMALQFSAALATRDRALAAAAARIGIPTYS